MKYYNKYIEYKSDYLNLRNNMYGGKIITIPKEKFILLHFTKNYDSLIEILKCGSLKASKYLRTDQMFMSGDTKSNYIYMSIYFDDLKNLTHAMDFTLIFDPKVYYKHKKDIMFNKGWGFKKMVLSKDRDKNIAIIKKYIQDLDDLPEKIKEFSPLLHHELLIEGKIKLKNNLIGIICNNCSKNQMEEINNILEQNRINNVKIFDRNIVPDYDKLL